MSVVQACKPSRWRCMRRSDGRPRQVQWQSLDEVPKEQQTPVAGVQHGKPLAVLVNHGSFNPVHEHHIRGMEQAKERLETAGYVVVEGIFAITNSEYIRQKGTEAMTDECRVLAMEEAFRELGRGWMRPDARGVLCGSGRSFIREIADGEMRAKHGPVTCFNFQGADVITRMLREGQQIPRPRPRTVLMGRSGMGDRFEAFVRSCDGQDEIFYVEELPGMYSSTRVREALARGDEVSVRELCPVPVATFLLSKSPQELYGDRWARRR